MAAGGTCREREEKTERTRRLTSCSSCSLHEEGRAGGCGENPLLALASGSGMAGPTGSPPLPPLLRDRNGERCDGSFRRGESGGSRRLNGGEIFWFDRLVLKI